MILIRIYSYKFCANLLIIYDVAKYYHKDFANSELLSNFAPLKSNNHLTIKIVWQ